jgi:hypothetical protein
MLSARGPREAEHRANRFANGTITPRPNSSLQLAGLDLSKCSRQQAAAATRDITLSFKKGVDTVPNVAASGKKGEVTPWSCQPEIIIPTPRTPETYSDIQRRHKKRPGPGEISVHWSRKPSDIPNPGLGYGVKSKTGESAAENFTSGLKFGIAEYVQSRGESIYQSVRMEPLGSAWQRGHVLPEETKQPSFKGFGKAILLDAVDAKETIFPRYTEPLKEEDKERYKRSHGNFDPGEALDRKYDWPSKVAENQHFRFGVTDTTKPGNLVSGDGAKTALTMDLEEDRSYPRSRIVDRTAETYRAVAGDPLGSGRNMFQGKTQVVPGHAYGMKSGHDNTHAGELVRGFYAAKDQLPDADLGKSKVVGRRNFFTKRPFGVPSVRHDLEAPPHHKRSVASATNYGDDQSAFNLLYPEKFGHRGVADSDFFVRRPAEEVRSLLEGAGYALEDQDFHGLWDEALQVHGDGEPFVSLEVMLGVVGHWMSVSGVKLGQTCSKTRETLLPVSGGSGIQANETLLPASEVAAM